MDKINKIEIVSKVWLHDSFKLFDYEALNIKKQKFQIQDTGIVFQNKFDTINFLKKNSASDTEIDSENIIFKLSSHSSFIKNIIKLL